MLKAVIFDMDGVIIDSEPLHYRVDDIIFDELGISLSYEERRSFVGVDNRRMWRGIKENKGLKPDLDELIETSDRIRNRFFREQESLVPVRGIPELLGDLKQNGTKIALASSSSRELIDIILGKLNLTDSFHRIIDGGRVEKGKPEPDIFILAAGELPEKRENCIVIEDSENGVNAAFSAGIYCIGYTNPNSREQDLGAANITVDDLSSLSFTYMNRLLQG